MSTHVKAALVHFAAQPSISRDAWNRVTFSPNESNDIEMQSLNGFLSQTKLGSTQTKASRSNAECLLPSA
jgi:hypothetical protein